MGLSTENPVPDEAAGDPQGAAQDSGNEQQPQQQQQQQEQQQQEQQQQEQHARGQPGSFDQPESRPEVMPREGGPHPEQTAEVPLGRHGESEPPGGRGHQSPPIQRGVDKNAEPKGN